MHLDVGLIWNSRIRWFLAFQIRFRYLFSLDPDLTCNNGFIKLFSFWTKYNPELTNSSLKGWFIWSTFVPTYLKFSLFRFKVGVGSGFFFQLIRIHKKKCRILIPVIYIEYKWYFEMATLFRIQRIGDINNKLFSSNNNNNNSTSFFSDNKKRRLKWCLKNLFIGRHNNTKNVIWNKIYDYRYQVVCRNYIMSSNSCSL